MKKQRLELILNVLCTKRNINVEAVKSRRHYPELALTRQLFFYFAHKYTDSFLTEIGEVVNVKTHSSVKQGITKIEEALVERTVRSHKHKAIVEFVHLFEEDMKIIDSTKIIPYTDPVERMIELEKKVENLQKQIDLILEKLC